VADAEESRASTGWRKLTGDVKRGSRFMAVPSTVK
jgi:hypothetical protein